MYSTFINSLFRAYTNGGSGSDPCDTDAATSRELFLTNPEAMCVKFTLNTELDKISFAIQDTPG